MIGIDDGEWLRVGTGLLAKDDLIARHLTAVAGDRMMLGDVEKRQPGESYLPCFTSPPRMMRFTGCHRPVSDVSSSIPGSMPVRSRPLIASAVESSVLSIASRKFSVGSLRS
jgi:hypothetical protein